MPDQVSVTARRVRAMSQPDEIEFEYGGTPVADEGAVDFLERQPGNEAWYEGRRDAAWFCSLPMPTRCGSPPGRSPSSCSTIGRAQGRIS